jgi:hypothetical protein
MKVYPYPLILFLTFCTFSLSFEITHNIIICIAGQEVSEDQSTESDIVTFVTPSGISVSVPREDLTQVPTFL